MITHIFFDYFGIIIPEWEANEVENWAKVLWISEDELRQIIHPYWHHINKGEISTKEFWESISNELSIKINKDPDQLFVDTVKNINIYPQMIDFVQELKQLKYNCIVLSDIFKPDEDFFREKWRYDVFDDLILSCEVGLSKLEDQEQNTSKIFEFALKKHWVRWENCLFVDDREENCKSAKRAGFHTVCVKNNPNTVIEEVRSFLNLKKYND